MAGVAVGAGGVGAVVVGGAVVVFVVVVVVVAVLDFVVGVVLVAFGACLTCAFDAAVFLGVDCEIIKAKYRFRKYYFGLFF